MSCSASSTKLYVIQKHKLQNYFLLAIIPDMPLFNKHSGMVDRLGHTSLENLRLESALEKAFHCKGQHIIQLVLVLLQQAIPVHPPQQSLSLKDPTGILLIEGQKHPSIVTDTAQSILNPPELPLAPETVLSHKLQLSIQTLLLIRTAWLLKSLAIYKIKLLKK